MKKKRMGNNITKGIHSESEFFAILAYEALPRVSRSAWSQSLMVSRRAQRAQLVSSIQINIGWKLSSGRQKGEVHIRWIVVWTCLNKARLGLRGEDGEPAHGQRALRKRDRIPARCRVWHGSVRGAELVLPWLVMARKFTRQFWPVIVPFGFKRCWPYSLPL